MRIKWFSIVRIIGLFFVLYYHFFENQFPGGFIGVDLFFTFSAFLITGLFFDEFEKSESFDLTSFFHRRFYRIVPPLVFSILIVMPFTLIINRDFLTAIGKQITAALGFVTNYYEIFSGGSYENKFIPHLFIHTWSLAIEIHFYIIWGLILFLLAKRVRKSEGTVNQKIAILRGQVFVVAGSLFLLSFLAMVIGLMIGMDKSVLYFSDLTHIFPFFIGVILASISGVRGLPRKFKEKIEQQSTKQTIGIFIGSLILLLVLGFKLHFDSWVTYVFGMLVASILAATMIFQARILHEKTLDIVEPKGLTFLADISYAMYLYHWPFIIIFGQFVGKVPAALLTVLFSTLFSTLSYYYLEPLLRGKTVPLFFDQSKQLLGKSKLTLEAIKKPGGAVLGILLVVMTLQIFRAPQNSQLESSLWLSGIQQDADALGTLEATLTSAKSNQYMIPKGVSVIGDSVTLGTREYLLAHVPNSSVDAAGNRKMNEAIEVMKAEIAGKTLREYVVIAVGTNSLDDYKEQTDLLLQTVPEGHRVILMTPHDGSADASYNSEKLAVYERSLVNQYKYVTLADWNTLAKAHPEAFTGTDGTHFGGNEVGGALYAQCINDALKAAEKTPTK